LEEPANLDSGSIHRNRSSGLVKEFAHFVGDPSANAGATVH